MREGLALPSVALPAATGGAVDLSRVAGRVLLILYPWTGRPGLPDPPNWDHIRGAHGSTPELEAFRDHAEEFAAIGIRLFALSRQDTAHQAEFAERVALPFPVLSDACDRLWPAIGAASFETGGVAYLTRATLLLEDGVVARVFAPVPDPAGHAAELLKILAG